MKETMNPISAVVATALGVLSAYMVQLFIPLIVLVIAMVVDYGGWTRIDCARDGQVRSVDDIHREVMERLRDLLEGIK